MARIIEVVDDNRVVVGSLVFNESPEHLSALRTGGGFELGFPMTVHLRLQKASDPCPLLTNFSALVTARNEANNALIVGRARYYGWLVGAIPQSSVEAELTWTDSLAALVGYEKFRNSSQPRFGMRVLGEL